MSDDVAQAALYLCGVADGRGLERVAIVTWLTARRDIFASGIWFARELEMGTHLAGDDE